MTRYVLDTNQIIAAGTRWVDGAMPQPDKVASRRLLIHVAKNETGLYCGKIMGEYLEKLLDKGNPPDRAARFVTLILGAFERVVIVTQGAPYPPSDPDDEIFVLCAMDGKADYLVSEDDAVLELQPHYSTLTISRAQTHVGVLGI
jgi:predicted nucleic acid-binding protein